LSDSHHPPITSI